MPISREYKEYLQSELVKRKPTLFESVNNLFGPKIPVDIPLDKDTEQKMWQQLEFVGWKTKPLYIYRTAIVIAILGVLAGISSLMFLGDAVFFIMGIGAGALLGYYWTIYLSHAVTFTRIRATADLLLSVLYMVISLRITPNFENALLFAAMNTTGTVGHNLKKIVWDLSLGKYESADVALEAFANKWKQENEEFSEAIDIIRTSSFKGEDERSKLYEEAINIILERNTDRMKTYTQNLAGPIAIINYLGITLPVLTIILFPILTIFLTQAIPPYLLVVVYNVILPIVVYWMINDTLARRPLSFGVRDISTHPDAHKIGTMKIGKSTTKLWPFSLAIGGGLISLGLFLIFTDPSTISLQKILGAMSVVWGAVGAIVFYSYFSYKGNDKIKDEISTTEGEFAEALFELGIILNSGYSVETSVEKLLKKIRNLKISSLFDRALDLIRKFGYTFERAIFDPKVGVILYYPSSTIRNILKIFTEALKKGSKTTSMAMISVSTYIKNIRRVEQFLQEMIAETTSEMQFMMSLLVPVSMGIIVGLAGLLSLVLANVAQFFTTVTGITSNLPIGDNSLISVLGDIKRVVPIEYLTIIVGVYMVEVILSLAVLVSTLRFGEDQVEKQKMIAKGLFVGTMIFTVVGVIVFLAFSGVANLGLV